MKCIQGERSIAVGTAISNLADAIYPHYTDGNNRRVVERALQELIALLTEDKTHGE